MSPRVSRPSLRAGAMDASIVLQSGHDASQRLTVDLSKFDCFLAFEKHVKDEFRKEGVSALERSVERAISLIRISLGSWISAISPAPCRGRGGLPFFVDGRKRSFSRQLPYRLCTGCPPSTRLNPGGPSISATFLVCTGYEGRPTHSPNEFLDSENE